MNNIFHSALKASPSKILLGIEQRNNADIELIDFLNEIAGTELDSDKDKLFSRELAVEATNKIKQYKIYYDVKHKKPSKYKADLVLIKDSTLKSDKKLKSNYKGFYQIAKILDMNRFVIKNIPGFNITQRLYNAILSPDRIKPWIKSIRCNNLDNKYL